MEVEVAGSARRGTGNIKYLFDCSDASTHCPGVSGILDTTPAPVVAVALRGLWGSFFSRKDGKAMSQPWRLRPLRRIALVIDMPVAALDASPAVLQEKVLALRGAWK